MKENSTNNQILRDMTINQFVKGVNVIFWDTLRENPKRSVVTSDTEPMKDDNPYFQANSVEWRELYGFVCSINGSNEKVPISQLDLISPGSLLAASLRGLKDTEDEFRKESEKFFSDRGIKVHINIQ